jgi:hypothetical protein
VTVAEYSKGSRPLQIGSRVALRRSMSSATDHA